MPSSCAISWRTWSWFLSASPGENDHLFGSVTSSDIAHGLEAKGFKVDRRKIALDEPLKTVGEFHVPVKLHRDVTAHFKVVIEKEAVAE
jgi:large subunit ribosomal protein L9